MQKATTAVLLVLAAAPALAGDITLYTRAHFGGPALTLHESSPDLDKLGFNDKTSSVIVHTGTWEVCENKQYKGKCLILQEGEYAELKDFSNMMSSVREIEPNGEGKDGKRDRAK